MLSMKTNQRPTRMSPSTRGPPRPAHRSLEASRPKVLGSAACIVDAPSVEGGALAAIDVETTTRTFMEDGRRDRGWHPQGRNVDAVASLRPGQHGVYEGLRPRVPGRFLGDGFGASAVVQQVAAELRQTFPELLGDTALRQAWAYAYPRDGHPRGIDVHSDDADVSVNIWITPNKANPDPKVAVCGSGTGSRPVTGPWKGANRDLDAIGSILQDGEASYVTIPYRFNRAIFLNGHRFHQTDSLHFAPGLENHRINLTFLFARRSDGGRRAGSSPFFAALVSLLSILPGCRRPLLQVVVGRAVATGFNQLGTLCRIDAQKFTAHRGVAFGGAGAIKHRRQRLTQARAA